MSTQAGKTIKTFLKNWISLVGILLLIVVFSILSQMRFGAQYFLTLTNWKTILLQTSTVAIVALGQSIMLMTGNFDLSLGRMLCLVSCVGAVLMRNLGWPTIPGDPRDVPHRHRPSVRSTARWSPTSAFRP